MANDRLKKLGIVWEDPGPVSQRGRGVNHQAAADQLKSNPGAWARVQVYAARHSAHTAATLCRQGRITAYNPPGAFEATVRPTELGFGLYVRFVGIADA